MKIQSWDCFLSSFATTCRLRYSADLAGLTLHEISKYRASSPQADAQYDEARLLGIDVAEDMLFERGFVGEETTQLLKGRSVTIKGPKSDSLAMLWMKGNRPDKYNKGEIIVRDPLTKLSDAELEILVQKKLGNYVAK